MDDFKQVSNIYLYTKSLRFLRYLSVLLFLKIDLTFVAPWWPRLLTDIFFVRKLCRTCTKDNVFQISKQSDWGFGRRRFFCQTRPLLTTFWPRMGPQVCGSTFFSLEMWSPSREDASYQIWLKSVKLYFWPIFSAPWWGRFSTKSFFLRKLYKPSPEDAIY